MLENAGSDFHLNQELNKHFNPSKWHCKQGSFDSWSSFCAPAAPFSLSNFCFDVNELGISVGPGVGVEALAEVLVLDPEEDHMYESAPLDGLGLDLIIDRSGRGGAILMTAFA